MEHAGASHGKGLENGGQDHRQAENRQRRIAGRREPHEAERKAMELGLFEVVIRTVERGDGLPLETKTTKVTGKGQQYFINKFLNKA